MVIGLLILSEFILCIECTWNRTLRDMFSMSCVGMEVHLREWSWFRSGAINIHMIVGIETDKFFFSVCNTCIFCMRRSKTSFCKLKMPYLAALQSSVFQKFILCLFLLLQLFWGWQIQAVSWLIGQILSIIEEMSSKVWCTLFSAVELFSPLEDHLKY